MDSSQESGGYILSANNIGGHNNNNNSQQALQSLLEDARNLVLGLRNRDSAVDTMLSKSQALHETVHTIKEYQSDMSDLNGCHRKPRSGLVHSLQQEDKQIRHLREENRELKSAVGDHQAVMKVLMDQHRAQTKKLKNLEKLQRFTETGCLSFSSNSSGQSSSEQAFGDFATVFTSCMKNGEEGASKDDEELDLLQKENDALRSLLGISQGGKAEKPPQAQASAMPSENPSGSQEPISEDEGSITPTPSSRNSPPPSASPATRKNDVSATDSMKTPEKPAKVITKLPPATSPKTTDMKEETKSKTPNSVEKSKSAISSPTPSSKSQTGTMKKATSSDAVKNNTTFPATDKKQTTPSKPTAKATVTKSNSNAESKGPDAKKKPESVSSPTAKSKEPVTKTKTTSANKTEDSKKPAENKTKTSTPNATSPKSRITILKTKGKSVEEKNESKENQVKKSNSFANPKISVKPTAQKAK